MLYSYRLYWGRNANPFFNDGRVVATRAGVGGVVGRKRAYFSWRFAVDFVGGNLTALGEKPDVKAVVSVSRGNVETISVRPVVGTPTWRAMFDYVPADESIDPVNL